MKKLAVLLLFSSALIFGQKFSEAEISLITKGNIETALPVFQTSDSLQHQVLLSKSIDANPKDKLTKILVNRMKLSLLGTDGGVGIAAPQVGINRNIVWAKRFDKADSVLEYFINPKILWRSEILNLGPEGDLSIEVFRDNFYRSAVIQLAIILQHEIDHLSGILISDRIGDQNLKTFEKAEFYREIK